MLRLSILLAAFLLGWLSHSARAQLASESISAARDYSASHNGRALLVHERGQLRFEDYYAGYAKGTPLHIYSGTKSFFSVLAVIAEEDGLLKLDEPVAKTLSEWRGDPRKERITIRDLLNFTSGLESGFEEIYTRNNEDKIKLAVGLKATRDRGQSFVYGPSHLNVFCEVLNRKLKSRRLDYETYLQRKLLGPLAIRVSRWREDAQGNPVPSAGMYLTAQEWLKFGLFLNAGGVANGRRLVRTDNLAECFVGTGINPSFGLCFWLNGYAGERGAREVDVEEDLELDPMPEDWRGAILCENAPRDLVVSLGSTFQRLYLVPSMDLVVIHHGKPGHEFRDFDFLEILFRGSTLPTVTAETPPQKRPFKPIFPKLFQKKNSETP
ncbi:MAG: serine hydrolase [Verrucomicrobiota bacterium]